MTGSSERFFGTDGIRGVAGVRPLNPETLVQLGKAIAKVFQKDKPKIRVILAKDTRLSGYMIETALASGLTSMGADVLLCGPLPTPGLAYLAGSMRVDAGVMISASHNSFEDNGIKIVGRDGYKIPDAVELEIEGLVQDDSLASQSVSASDIGKAIRIDDAVGRYTVYLKNCFSKDFTLEGRRIGFDCANGAGYIVGPQTCEELGADVVARGISPNGKNINSGFGSLYPEVVRELVSEYNLSIGIALDGDADRAVLADEKGNLVDGDMILAVIAKDLAERGKLRKPVIVGTVMSNLGLEKYLSSLSLELVRSPVGDRNVLEAMKETGAQIGGEQSGHIIFRDYSTTGDGILTGLQVLEVMCRANKPLSELCSEFERFPQTTLSVPVKQKTPIEEVEPLKRIIDQKEEDLTGRGRLLVRYSGTESKLRVMVECDNEDDCKRHAQDIAEVVRRELGEI